MKRLLPVFCCVVFLLSGACSPTKKRVFPNSDRIFAMEMVRKQCEIVPRHSGSAGAERTADLILKTARSMPGITAETDSFEEDTPSGKIVFRNVIAKLPGKGKGTPVILGALKQNLGSLSSTFTILAAIWVVCGVMMFLAANVFYKRDRERVHQN